MSRVRLLCPVPVLAVAMLCFTVACGGDDGDDGGGSSGNNPFPGVSRWDCYADSTAGSCECYGLAAGEQLEVAGSSISPVANCAGYAACFTYRDFFGDPVCGCGAAGFAPADDSTDVQAAANCPP